MARRLPVPRRASIERASTGSASTGRAIVAAHKLGFNADAAAIAIALALATLIRFNVLPHIGW